MDIPRFQGQKLEPFREWLVSRGAELLPTTNEWEVLRFRCLHGTGVIYQNSRGHYKFSGPVAIDAYRAFATGKPWDGHGKKSRLSKGARRRKQQLLIRDGDECFYCGQPMGTDITEEHLLSHNQGGSYRLENLALAHGRCNQQAGNLPIVEKVKLASFGSVNALMSTPTSTGLTRKPLPAHREIDMPEYKVNADFLINVEVLVEAESEDEAHTKSVGEILNKDCEWLDPVKDPEIKHIECTGWEYTACTAWHHGDVMDAHWQFDQPFCDFECAQEHIESMV